VDGRRGEVVGVLQVHRSGSSGFPNVRDGGASGEALARVRDLAHGESPGVLDFAPVAPVADLPDVPRFFFRRGFVPKKYAAQFQNVRIELVDGDRLFEDRAIIDLFIIDVFVLDRMRGDVFRLHAFLGDLKMADCTLREQVTPDRAWLDCSGADGQAEVVRGPF